MCALKSGEPDQSQQKVEENSGLYACPEDALKKVVSEFEYWTAKLTDTSLQMCYALIGANWVIFGSLNGILGNVWSKFSLILVLLALASNVIGAWLLSESLRRRISYAELDERRWKDEFLEIAPHDVAWPFTDAIQNTGKYMRWIKVVFTLSSGGLLIVGAVIK